MWLWHVHLSASPFAWLAVYVHRFLLRDLSKRSHRSASRIEEHVALYALLACRIVGVLPIWRWPHRARRSSASLDIADRERPAAESIAGVRRPPARPCFASASDFRFDIAARLCLVLARHRAGRAVTFAPHGNAARGNALAPRRGLRAASLVLLSCSRWLLFRDDATPSPANRRCWWLLGDGAVTVVEVAALSLAYRELTHTPRHRPQIHLPDSGREQHASHFRQRAARGHDVVDHGHVPRV